MIRSWTTSSLLSFLAVDAGVALLRQELLHLLLGEVVRDGDGEGEEELPAARGSCVGDALRGVPAHLPAAVAAVQPGGAREEQLQVVVELRHGADRGARGAHGVGLVDGDGGRDALDAVHARLVHPVQELPRVGGEGLHVAALALGVEGVEGQGRLARAAHAGDHDELPQRQLQAEVSEVVLPRPLDEDEITGAASL